MEENKEEKVEVKKKTRTTKKKEENSRVSDILQKIEVEEKKQTKTKVKKEEPKQTDKKETTKKVKSTKNEDKEENKTTKKTSKSNSKNKVETKKKSENKNVEKKEEVKKENKTKKEVKDEKETKPKKEKEVKTKKVNKKVETEKNELEKIEEEIKKQKKLPKEIAEKVNKKIYGNILIAITMVIYLIFINLGYTNINQIAFITDLQVFSIALMVTTIIIFEKAYKKDSGKLTINGIEVLSLAILTMFLPRIYNKHKDIFVDIVGIASIVYVVYYFVKCIIIYAKTRKKIRKSDAKKISKK